MAINAVTNAGVAIREASRTYNVPYGTLHRRIKSGISTLDVKPGTKPSLGADVEQHLVSVITQLQHRGFGLTRIEVRIKFQCKQITLN